MAEQKKQPATLSSRTATVLFCAVAVCWFALDRWSKLIADAHQVNQVFVKNVLNLFEFRLAHNTGAAWSMFSNSTLLLGVFSLLVCALILVYFFGIRKARMGALECLGIALVFSGGLGNAFDRLVNGYVVDFINATFISYPIFNVADIGVVCGIVLFFIGFLLYMKDADDEDEIKDGAHA